MALLDGKVTLVSGAGPGLGRDVALACGREGATVVVAARTEDKVQALAAEVQAAGAPALGLCLDITDAAQCREGVQRIVEAYGRLDVLVNNAFDDGDRTPFLEADLDRWRHTTEVNLFGTLQLTQVCAPQMVAQGDGRIVMVNSMSAVRIRPGWGAYTASKAGLAAVTKVLAAELGEHGVRVNGVHPGYIWGDSVEAYFDHLAKKKGITAEEQYREVASETALGYLPHSSEVAEAVVFFASDMSKPITGQALGVNAGQWFQGF
ncbi:MAG TPA: SDR family NAD(P)-dependent oxidoreductase [Acidimicrobiales bacterium]|nr:SDR family NAD(P)-dependent oxidoreductase [Acidimicrobiales bacterium]